MVNVDLLDYSVAQKAADSLSFLLQEPPYNRNEGNHIFVVISCIFSSLPPQELKQFASRDGLTCQHALEVTMMMWNRMRRKRWRSVDDNGGSDHVDGNWCW